MPKARGINRHRDYGSPCTYIYSTTQCDSHAKERICTHYMYMYIHQVHLLNAVSAAETETQINKVRKHQCNLIGANIFDIIPSFLTEWSAVLQLQNGTCSKTGNFG